jgi:hypothetical protein
MPSSSPRPTLAALCTIYANMAVRTSTSKNRYSDSPRAAPWSTRRASINASSSAEAAALRYEKPHRSELVPTKRGKVKVVHAANYPALDHPSHRSRFPKASIGIPGWDPLRNADTTRTSTPPRPPGWISIMPFSCGEVGVGSARDRHDPVALGTEMTCPSKSRWKAPARARRWST